MSSKRLRTDTHLIYLHFYQYSVEYKFKIDLFPYSTRFKEKKHAHTIKKKKAEPI